MNTTGIPPSIPLVRDIAYELWKLAVTSFDGVHPVIAKTEYRHPDIWSYCVELYENEIMCVTRKNCIVVGTIPARVFK